ncbi:MAG: M20/M25/M40 family metallo-hydrolase [Acidobacteriaceae bacterium]|nr:M20/M25/M40 family metallo-hydrolase [Acidobacteriaceae bacterium]MBV9764210.1 M20/M25/M40 family metallo-hydrolase [Acidobacteriaceae bacterium]
MATQPKTLLPPPSWLSSESRRIAQLAEEPALFDAQRWFTRERAWINEQQLQLCRIPAPTFFEQARAEWFRDQLQAFGWAAKLDRAGNVLAVLGGESSQRPLVVSAHLDTVYAPVRPEEVYYGGDGRLFGPGVSDNGSGLAALLALARVLTEVSALDELRSALLLVANVGEEGEGNLNGMRYLCQMPQLPAVEAFVVLDGPSTDHITAQALASRRYEINFSGPGGHSWNDYGTPNPVHALSEAISFFIQNGDARMAADHRGRCSYNFGIIEGGSSINSIPASARAKLDLRAEEPEMLEELSNLLTPAVERGLERENRAERTQRLNAKIKELGSRPGGKLPDESPLLRTIQGVDAYLNIRSRIDCASTDANVPLSMGVPAISIGAGGQGGGAHTNQEWYQPEGREVGLRRILLTLASLAEQNRVHGS